MSLSSSHFHLIYKTRAHDSFFTKLFSREAADNKWSIFIFVSPFPLKSQKRATHKLLSVFSHLHTIVVKFHQLARLSSLASTEVAQLPPADPPTVCLTQRKVTVFGLGVRPGCWLWLLFCCFDTKYWWGEKGYVAQLSLRCSSEFGLSSEFSLISILVPHP